MKAILPEIFHDLVLNPWEYSYLLISDIDDWVDTRIVHHFDILDISYSDTFNVVLKDVTVEYRDWDNLPGEEQFRGWYAFYNDAVTIFHLRGYKQWRGRDGIYPTGRPKRIPGAIY